MITELGEPDSIEFLNEYLDFTLNYVSTCDGYSENHHILPRSLFKDYKNDSWNIVNLLYSDHVFSHELLANAYINRATLRPLNFMKSQTSKNTELISKAAKKGWIKLKNNPVKYKKFCDDRSEHIKSLSSIERSRRSQLMWDNLTESQYIERCISNKNSWTSDRRNIKSKQMTEYFKNNPNEMSNRSSKMWDNMNPIDKQRFNNTMNIVNKDPIKRASASESIKQKWKDPAFRENMNNRKTSNRKVIAISPSGNIHEFNGLGLMVKTHNFNRGLINKFRNSGKPVISNNVKNKESVANTIGWKFNYTKYGETNFS